MRKLIIIIILLLMMPMVVNAKPEYLYDVLKNEAESNGLAKEYTGEHHDSFLEEPSKKIYHWYAENDEQGNQVIEKNNVIFANHCWQMFRTTDTGGVKLLYNGEVEEGKCLDNRSNHVGYTRGIKLENNSNYYFSNSYNYNSELNLFELSENGDNHIWNEESQSELTGLYTCGEESLKTCQTLYYVLPQYLRNIYDSIGISNDSKFYQYGTSQYNGKSYSLSSMGYMFNKENVGEAKYVHGNPSILCGKSFTYENGIYTLVDKNYLSAKEINNYNGKGNYTCFNDTGQCENLAYVVSTWGWRSSQGSYDDYGHLRLLYLNGKNSIEEVINEMLYANDVNNKDSIIKLAVELWFEKYLKDYSSALEDTIYCNNRTITAGYETNTVLSFEGRTTTNLNLLCNNTLDKFSTENDLAKIKYKVGLITTQELRLLNNNIIRAVGTSQYSGYWTMTPWMYGSDVESYITKINDNGTIGFTTDPTYYPIQNYFGLRPVISLNNNAKFNYGDGSKENPYFISKMHSISTQIVNETEEMNININDLSQVSEGEEVNFKITPIKGRKLTNIKIVDENNNEIEYTTTDNKNYKFTMPSSNITIIPSYERVKNAVNVEDNINTKEFVIEVNDSKAVVYEDTVRFRVSPEEGYEVEKIEITDEENNNISYKKTNNINEYEFTMPDTNVLIKPFYRLINKSSLPNPNTKRQIILIIISILLLGIMTTIFVKKKKRLN